MTEAEINAQAFQAMADGDADALKRLKREAHGSQRTSIERMINGLERQRSGSTKSNLVDASKPALQNLMEMSRMGDKFTNTVVAGADGMAQFIGELGKAKTPGAKMKALLHGLAGGLGGLTELLNSSIDDVEEYRIELIRAGDSGAPMLKSLADQNQALTKYGVRLKTLHKAQTEFRENLAAITKDAFSSGKELRKLAAINERFGISVGQSTTFMNKLNIGFNTSAKQTDKMSRQLLQFAKKTGQPFEKVWADFNQGIEKFMFNMDPDKAMKKFTVFQRMARELGSDVGSLVDVVDKFDDLETGMQYGGELNMLLSSMGGSFDAVQATLMSQPERMKYIADQLQEVGGRIEGMSELGQRAVLKQVASTTGLDIGVVKSILQKDVGADVGKYMKNADALGTMQMKDQEELAQKQTTRDERREQRNDMMINNMTIHLERVMQKQSQLQTTIYKTEIPQLLQKLEAVGVTRVLNLWEGKLKKWNKEGKMNMEDYTAKLAPNTGEMKLLNGLIGKKDGPGLVGGLNVLAGKIDANTRAQRRAPNAPPKSIRCTDNDRLQNLC